MTQSNQTLNKSEATDSGDFPHEDRDDEFRIHSAVDIHFILREIMQSTTLITLYFDQSKRFILSSVLAVNPQDREMIIDYGADENLNQQVLRAGKIMIVATQAQAEVKMTCAVVEKMQFEGNDAFLIKLPKSLVRIQRRDFFRISTPKINKLKCSIPLSDGSNSDQVELTLVDISCGGIGIVNDQPTIRLEPDTIFKNCEIELPDIGTISATIRIKHTHETTTHNGIENKRIGCEFIALPGKMLAMIQRYMIKLEQIQRQSREH